MEVVEVLAAAMIKSGTCEVKSTSEEIEIERKESEIATDDLTSAAGDEGRESSEGHTR